MLVQINGKRFNRSALVQVYVGGDTALSFGSQGADISAIPSIAIKNLQVLRDGATAQYGSDAIAGVMNFGLRNDRQGVELQARYGQYFDHGDTKLDNGNSRQIAGAAGFGIGATGFIDVAGEWFKDDGTSRGETRPVALVFAQQHPDLANQLPNYPLPVQIWGSSPQHGWKAVVNSGIDVTEQQPALSDGAGRLQQGERELQLSLADHRDGRCRRRRAAPIRSAPTAHSPPLLPDAVPGEQRDLPGRRLSSRTTTPSLFTDIYPAGFTPRFVGITKERWGTAGWKGSSTAA